MAQVPGLEAVDWSRPWLAPWRAIGEPLATCADRHGLVDALNAAAPAGAPRFVHQHHLPAGEPYEAFIARTGSVPTRANVHDFFNGLAWLRHPALKRRLNELQAAQIVAAPRGASRGAVRDTLTLFDENAALLQGPAPLVDALRRRDWHALFVTQRAAWTDVRLELFGHALLEKLVRPRAAITAHAWVVPQGVEAPGAWSAASLTPAGLAAKPFLPLPVLGVPGWWGPNEALDFYGDATVFRVAQKQTAARGPLF